jgi:hypothetical protein
VLPEESITEPESDLDISTEPVDAVVHKSVLNDRFDDERLLQQVPSIARLKAEKLINELKEFPNDLNWNTEGTVFLDKISLPNSDIFTLFPKLFKRIGHPHKTLYLFEIASKIATLGFGNLINTQYTIGLSRRKPVLNHVELRNKIDTRKNWWYLG